MTQRDRERIARKHLYRYAQYARDVRQYEQSVFGATHNETGIRGSEISDPTARSGIALAEPPKDLRSKRRWIEAIDASIIDLALMDGHDAYGYVYICTHMFGMNGQKHKRDENRETALKIAGDCNLSVRALYNRAGTIVNTVIYHAAGMGLFEDEKKEASRS